VVGRRWWWVFETFAFFTIVFEASELYVPIKYLPSHHGIRHNSDHRLKCVLPPILLLCKHYEAVAGGRWWWVFASFNFLPNWFFHDTQLLFQLNTYGHITGSATTLPTDWTLALHPHPLHANSSTQHGVCFECKFYFLHLLYHCCFFMRIIFSIKYCGHNTGLAKSQPTDWSMALHPYYCHTNNNRLQLVFLWDGSFILHLFYHCI